MQRFRRTHLSGRECDRLEILDVGAMDVNGSYRPLFDEAGWHYRGADLEPGRNVDIVLTDPYRFDGVASGSLDVVVSGQALEHMPRFWMFFLEVFRCLKPGGLCCIIAPAGGYEHRYPVDCWRFYPDGMIAAAEYARLRPIEVFTDWTPRDGYPDDSKVWQDTVLIAEKPEIGQVRALRLAFRAWALRALR
ncbi:MAG TPA: methyltransferase domain-containing protein [Azoarcus taiwanensis]|nr:methyltransferase domain-containing protein [Azoarcus taiwanensis]